MAVYLVAYDLIKEARGTHDYTKLYRAFGELDTHKVLYSVRLVSTTMTPQELKGYLFEHMDENDRIWVDRVRKGEHAYSAMQGTNGWLEVYPPN